MKNIILVFIYISKPNTFIMNEVSHHNSNCVLKRIKIPKQFFPQIRPAKLSLRTKETEVRGQMTIPTQAIPKAVTSHNPVTEPVYNPDELQTPCACAACQQNPGNLNLVGLPSVSIEGLWKNMNYSWHFVFRIGYSFRVIGSLWIY